MKSVLLTGKAKCFLAKGKFNEIVYVQIRISYKQFLAKRSVVLELDCSPSCRSSNGEFAETLLFLNCSVFVVTPGLGLYTIVNSLKLPSVVMVIQGGKILYPYRCRK